MKPTTGRVLVVMAFTFGLVALMPNLSQANAASSERINLVQKFEQFSGQEITGYCNIQTDDNGNLQWRIKVNGLSPKTEGYFNLNHWVGEENAQFTADDEGKADSGNQIVLKSNLLHSFSSLAKCQVQLSGITSFLSPVIAVGSLDDNNEDDKNTITEKKSDNKNPSGFALGSSDSVASGMGKNKNQSPTQNKNFILYSLDYFLGIFTNSFGHSEEHKSINIEKSYPKSNEIENSSIRDESTVSDLTFGPPLPSSFNHPPIANDSSVTVSEGSTLSIILSGFDADGDELSYNIVNEPIHGFLTGDAPSLTYTPEGGYNGIDNFTFNVSDGRDNSSAAKVSIIVDKIVGKPSIFITSPIENSVVKDQIKISATVNSYPNARVIFYVDGFPIGMDSSEPYEIIYDVKELKPGKHTIKADVSSSEFSHSITILKSGDGGNKDHVQKTEQAPDVKEKVKNEKNIQDKGKEEKINRGKGNASGQEGPNNQCNRGKQNQGNC